MGVSIHSDEYREMKEEFNEKLKSYIGIPFMPDKYYEDLTFILFSIMNDYGAVDFT